MINVFKNPDDDDDDDVVDVDDDDDDFEGQKGGDIFPHISAELCSPARYYPYLPPRSIVSSSTSSLGPRRPSARWT